MSEREMTKDQQDAYNTALQRIKSCHRGKKRTLNLGGLGLSQIPPEIGDLKALRRLDLSDNQLISLPVQIGGLTSLKSLILSGNQLVGIPLELCKLATLSTLNLSDNQLTDLPSEIGELFDLTILLLDGNELTRLPPEIGQLRSLNALSIVENKLGSLPPEIGQLTALTLLFLSLNQLNSLPSEIWFLTGLTTLDLDGNELQVLPSEIGLLKDLSMLNLSCNQLRGLPPELGQLSALKTLQLGENQLRALPPEIGRLTALSTLFLFSNELSNIPSEVGDLTALQELLIGDNLLEALPPEIGQLTALNYLDLNENLLSDLPPEIGSLSVLHVLILAKNQLRGLPPETAFLKELMTLDLRGNQLSVLPPCLRDLPKIERLYLHDNFGLPLSPAVLGQQPYLKDGGEAAAKSILDFYFERKKGKNRPLNEVKLILVGRGGAGKTSTVQALQNKPFNETEESTPGIALCDWTMDGCKKGAVTAHVWDFAGQVITHALHQFFFSIRSVYVVVLTGRENNERDDAEYWLRLIKAFGTDDQGNGPPVIVALNKWDTPGCRPGVDRAALQERYPFVRGFVEIDCKTQKGISKLKVALCREVDRLPWVREPFPAAWDAVRRALSTGRKKRAHLTYAEYRALCATHGIADEGQQDSLAEILHHLGAALNYRNDPRLREATVLQPEWLTKNVYALVRRAEKKAGVLMQSDVDTVLRYEKDVRMRAYLMQIMERFEIAYAPRATDDVGGLWLVPQALPDKQPQAAMDFRNADNATRLRYGYSALPEGLVARAIVRLHAFIEEVSAKKLHWASGVILSREGARALIRTEPQDRQVMITVVGPVKARQQLAGLCQAEMRGIHAEIRGLDPIEETLVRGTWVAIATLEADEKKNQQTGVPTKNNGTVMVDPAESNNAYSQKVARTNSVWKPTVFISYSKSNVNQRKRLESELKILKNEGLLAGLWHDRMIDPGDEWDDAIQRELSDADVFIFLASSAALATDYITVQEIPKALELHRTGKMILVPVILEACRWHMTPLGALNALPEKAKPLDTWKPVSVGWNSMANGLATVLQKLIAHGGSKKRDTSHHLPKEI